MSNWKKAVYLIIGVIIFVVIKLWFNQIDKMAAAERYPYELAQERKANFEDLTEYCREHEDVYMEISERIFCYLDEGLSKDEALAAMEKNATLEQKEILEKHSLRYPRNENDYVGHWVGLEDKGVYYGGGDIKVVYIHEYSKEIEESIMSVEYTTTEKINDHLYVCYTAFPYT